VHYVTGTAAILFAYWRFPFLGWPVALAYFAFAVVQLYVLMPLIVCPSCVYRTIEDGRCASGLNLLSARFCPPSTPPVGFEGHVHGALCQSSLCLWSWVSPMPLVIPGLLISFSWIGLALIVCFAVLTTLRLTAVVRRAVCPHCLARRWCPVARAGRLA
jgi:hypothetical protein